MSAFASITLLTLGQFLCGFGLVRLFRLRLALPLLLPFSVLLGVAVFSFMPFVLQLFYIPLTAANVFASLGLSCLLLNLRGRKNFWALVRTVRESRFRVRLYEWPALLLITWILLISVWRCFYLPPTPRDLTSGAEVIATYAVKEKTMINSVFTVNLETTNNQFKPPFITSLQIIYKYAGFPFGQIWLSAIFVSFIVFLYHALRLQLHRVFAGLLLVMFLAIPEMYAYTFTALFDYSNAVFFFLSCWFFFRYFDTGEYKDLAFAGLLMGIATYIRSETLVLAGLMFPALIWRHVRRKENFGRLLRGFVLFILPSFFLYLLSVTIYIRFYLPVAYNVEGLVNRDLLDPSPLFERFIAINGELIFSNQGVMYYGYFFFLFLLILIFDLVFSDRLNRASRNWIFAVGVIYFGYPLLGHLLPLLDVQNSTKRGLFKIFPLMLLYFGSSGLLTGLSERLSQWEQGETATGSEKEETTIP